MTGTQNHEGMAGVTAAVEYLAELGRRAADHRPQATDHRSAPAFEAASGEGGAGASHADDDRAPGMVPGRRAELLAAMRAIQAYERALSERLVSGLLGVPGLTFYGITDLARFAWRTPTVSVRVAGHTPRALAERLGRRGIFTWDGNYYALNLTERLGVEASGGMLRIGLVHYNTPAEIDRLLAALHELAG